MQEQASGGLDAWYRRWRWVLDPIAMALLSVVMAAFGFRGIWGSYSLLPVDVSPWWALVLALPACGLALLKHRAPMLVLTAVAVLFAIDILTVGGVGTLVVLLDVLWLAVFVASPRVRRTLLLLLGASIIALFAAALVVAELPFAIAFLIAIQFGAIFGTDYWWAVAVAQANELADLHRQRAEAAEHESERDRTEAVNREREMMARELHDAVAGHVLAMAIRAEAALSTSPDETADRAALQAVRDAGLDAHTALRTMISVLRGGGGELAAAPRLEDLDGVITEARRTGLEVTETRSDERFSVVVEQTLVRIVRESLANCVRHAAGAKVDVVIAHADGSVGVSVESRGGSPRAHAAGNGWGLSMLNERVRALEGTFHAGPVDGGWSVHAELPLTVRT
ncbi:sensor histidine kinase [Microbacterium murale]|nr:histidine kinase [Microbacterium murale]